jgi:hypothetical protein
MLGMLVTSMYLGVMAGGGHHDDVRMVLESSVMAFKGGCVVSIVGYDNL